MPTLHPVWDAFTTAKSWSMGSPKAIYGTNKNTWILRLEGAGLRHGLRRRAKRWQIQNIFLDQSKTNFKFSTSLPTSMKIPNHLVPEWDSTFSEQNGKTTVRIIIYNRYRLSALKNDWDGFHRRLQSFDSKSGKRSGRVVWKMRTQ